MEAFCDLRTLRLIVAYFLALTGALGTIYWIPTFVKRLSGVSDRTVTSLLLIFARHDVPLAILFLLLGSGFLYAFFPTFWAIPTMTLSESAAAATFGLINSIGQLGGFAGNYTIGLLNVRTHSLTASFGFIAFVYVVAGGLIVSLGIRNPLRVAQR